MLKWLRFVLLTASALLGPTELQARERIAIDFRTLFADWPGIKPFGPDAEAREKSEPQGLRITLPAGRQDNNSVGLDFALRIHGDFEVTLGYELLAVGEPIPESGAGVQMMLIFDTPVPLKGVITRLRKPNPKPAKLFDWVGPDGETFGAARIDQGPDGKDNLQVRNYRAEQPRGKLTIQRVGPEVQYWVADGDRAFHLLQSRDLGSSDVKAMRVFCFSGYRPGAVDLRLTELTLEGEQVSISGKHPGSEVVPTLDADSSWSGRPHLLILGGLVVGALLIAVGAVALHVVRKRRRDSQRREVPVPRQ